FDVDERTVLHVDELIRQGKFTPDSLKDREKALAYTSAAAMLGNGGLALLPTVASSCPDKKWAVVPVSIGVATETGYPHKGRINFRNNQVDPSTGTLRVRGIFDNRNRALAAGLFVRVQVPIGPDYKATLVSETALGTSQGQKFLYVLNDENEV